MNLIKNKAALMQELARGSLVITPNNRLSASLIEDYYHYSGMETVDKPLCLPYLSFIPFLYRRLLSHGDPSHYPRVLKPHQTRSLWQQILSSQTDLTYSKGLLQAVTEAWSHCMQWQISPQDEAFKHSPQCLQFQQWWQAFEKKCSSLQAISDEHLPQFLIEANQPLFTGSIVWACFDDFTPQQKTLQNHLSAQGVQHFTYELSKASTTATVYAAKDHDDEFQQIISWLHYRLEAGDQKIAVVVPDLQQGSKTLQRQLKRYLSADLFNLSLGKSLNEYPLVSHALQWLNLNPKHLHHEQTRLLLHSPYVKGSKKEFHQRAQVIQDATFIQEKSQPLRQCVEYLKNKTPILADCLGHLNAYPEMASPQQWVDLFHARLESIGYPGEYGLNSENYQCYQRFTDLFHHFMQLHFVHPAMTAYEALYTLQDLAQQTIFQPQTVTKKPVQILGLLEASGCEFDSLWVMGLTDQCLPKKTRLSSFIPHPLQREHNMPHSSPERELLFARKIIERFKKASSCNVFSYPEMSGDTPNLVSPLIADLKPCLALPQALHEQAIRDLLRIDDQYSIPLKDQENISGGTALLANQAKCPFKAFAAHRLNAKPIRALKEGFDQMERGQIVHKIMEIIWRQLGNQQQLLLMDDASLDACIETAIITALSSFLDMKQHTTQDLIQEIELTRLKRLVLACLDWEKKRPPFEVLALEEEYIIPLHQIDFRVRVDRLDRVENDEQWVIDYKTTLPSSRPWQEERPKEPQMLLYALINDSINTLMFIQLKSGQVESKSFSETPLSFKGNSSLKKNEQWEDYRLHWRQLLEDLAKEFSEGHCLPQPLSPSLCEQCDFQSLCRFSQENV